MPLALATLALVALVLVVAVALLAARLTTGSSGSGAPPTPTAPTATVSAVSTVPAGVLDTVGAPGPPLVEPPTPLGSSTTVRKGALPAVVYVGTEYCPFCAAERWALVVALGRFGHFTHLGMATSSRSLVFPRLRSFSFRGSTYTSRWVAFEPTETYSASGTHDNPSSFAALQGIPPQVAGLLRRFDAPPLAPASGALPFVDVGGRSLVIGAGFSPAVLSGLSLTTIAGDLRHPSSRVAQAIDGTANELTAAICSTTGGVPATVCTSAAARAGAIRNAASASSHLAGGSTVP